MSRRRAARRARNIGAVSFLLGTAAVLLAPPASARARKVPVSMTATTTTRTAKLTESQSFFRPAGEVLRRSKTASAPALPFFSESREKEQRESLSRWHRVYTYATRYSIRPELAGKIYDAAVRAGIEPELGFRLVRVESEFNVRATSPVGALGLMQLMPATARAFEPGLTNEQIYDPDVNLRIGFKYLRALIRENNGNVRLALLVYNRGPTAVRNALSMGLDPTNGYENVVMRGFRGKAVLD